MNDIFEYIHNNEFVVISEKIKFNSPSSDQFEYKYMLDFNVKYESISSLTFPDEFFDYTFFANGSTLKSNKDIKDLQVPYEQPEFFTFNLISKRVLSEEINKLFFYNKQGAENFIIDFSKVKINTLPVLKNKIQIFTYLVYKEWKLNNSHSSLFQINETAVEDLSSKTTSYLQTLKKKELVIGLLPKYVSEDYFERIPLLPLIKSLLSTIANDTNRNSVYIKGRHNLKITLDKEYNNAKMISHFNGLSKLYYFIYTNDVNADQKKTFVRKSICNNLLKDEEIQVIDLENTYFEDIYKDSNYLFETFENGEVSIFLKEKKEILKEYMSYSKEILSNINSLKSSLFKTLSTTLTIVLINTSLRLLPRFENTEDFKIVTNVFILTALAFLVFAIFLFYISDFSLYKLTKKKSEIFESQFKFLSAKSDELKENYATLIKTDIENYKNLLSAIILIYALLLSVLIIILITNNFAP